MNFANLRAPVTPKIVRDERGCIRLNYPAGYKGPYAANPFASTDADVLARVVAEMRAHFSDEDPATNPGFADFLRDLDRLDQLARSLRGRVETRTNLRGSTSLVGVAR